VAGGAAVDLGRIPDVRRGVDVVDVDGARERHRGRAAETEPDAERADVVAVGSRHGDSAEARARSVDLAGTEGRGVARGRLATRGEAVRLARRLRLVERERLHGLRGAVAVVCEPCRMALRVGELVDLAAAADLDRVVRRAVDETTDGCAAAGAVDD